MAKKAKAEALLGESQPEVKPRKQQSRTSERQIEAAQKRAQALQLRIAGVKLEKIAEVVGYASKSGAHSAIKSALKEMVSEPAEELRTLQHLRLEELFFGLYPLARKGHLDTIDRVLKIFEREARLLGLDMPTKVAPTDPSGKKPYEPEPGVALTDAERTTRLIALYEHVRARLVREASDEQRTVVSVAGSPVGRLPVVSE